MPLTLSAHPPFDLTAVVQSHGWVQLPPFAFDVERETLRYVSRLSSGRVVALTIRPAEDGVCVNLDANLDTSAQDEIARQVTWMLGLGQDLSPFYALVRREPKLARVEARAQGRLLRSPALFTDIVKTILTTNTSWAGTIRMNERLIVHYGDPLPSDPTRRAFPTATRLAAADEATLRAEAGLGYRAPYVLALARAVAAGELDVEALKSPEIPTRELRKRLLAIKGVGNYAAAHLLMLLERYDFVPVDSWARKMVAHEWRDGASIEKAEVEAAFERWGKWRGLAYWFWDWAYFHEAQQNQQAA